MKKFLIILVVGILIVGIAFLVSKNINSGNANEQKTNTTTKSNIQNTQTNTNTVKTNTIKNEVNNVVENVVNNENTEETSGSETFNEEPETEQEKAISIVRNNWGADDSITISIENINSDGTYIVTVRDASTTEAKAFYRVNVSDNSIKNAF